MKKNLKNTLCDKLVSENRVKEGDIVRHSYTNNRLDNGDKNMGRIENHEGLSPTLDTRCDCLGICVEDKGLFENEEVVDFDSSDAFRRNHNELPTLVCKSKFGVVEKEQVKLVGGVGKMKSNNGTQFYEQDRIYDSEGLATSIPAESAFHPYYQTNSQFEPKQDLIPEDIIFYIMGLCGIIEVEERIKNDERIRKILPILWQEIGKKEIQREIRRFWGVLPKKILRPNLYEQGICESWELQPRERVGTPNFKDNSEKDFDFTQCLFTMWEKWKNRYTPYRWELSQQQFEQFNSFMSQLPHETTQREKEMYDLWKTSKRFRVLRETLSKVQEIWRSIIPQKQSVMRIRKLTPLTCMRLMGFSNEDYQAMRDIGMSDAAIYHMAGDSIVVPVLISIFSQLMFEDDRHKDIVKKYIEKEVIEQ